MVVIDLSADSPFACLTQKCLLPHGDQMRGRVPYAAASWELQSLGALGTGVTGHSCSYYVPSLPESLHSLVWL